MVRLPRVVVPGCPHHVTQRGNRRLPTFFSDEDYEAYLALMAEQCADRGVAIRAWCLMPNHVHLVAVPETAEALAVGEAHLNGQVDLDDVSLLTLGYQTQDGTL